MQGAQRRAGRCERWLGRERPRRGKDLGLSAAPEVNRLKSGQKPETLAGREVGRNQGPGLQTKLTSAERESQAEEQLSLTAPGSQALSSPPRLPASLGVSSALDSFCLTHHSHHGWAELRLQLDPLLPGLEVLVGRNSRQCVVMPVNPTGHALPDTLGRQALTCSACMFTFSKMHYWGWGGGAGMPLVHFV